jgi:Flp pilus assembly protein TadG
MLSRSGKRGGVPPLGAERRSGGSGGSPPRANTERGSVAVFTVIFAMAVILLTALIVDGGVAMNARERAADIAEQAARAAAGDINVAALRNTGVATTGPGACTLAGQLVQQYARGSGAGVDAVTSAAMDSCTAGPDTATVQVTITTRPLIPGVLGEFTETAQESATAQCGINQGALC